MKRRSPFDPLVQDYERGRPRYPAPLFAALAEVFGSLAGCRIVEVGAGTGIATLPLVKAGSEVIAIDRSEPMLRLLRRKTQSAAAVVADGHSLPVISDWANLVCFAQSWHWMRPSAALKEVVRVLRPRGALAVWWNDGNNRNKGWWQDQQDRLNQFAPDHRSDYRDVDYTTQLTDSGLFNAVARSEWYWSRSLSVDDYLRWLRSKSYIAQMGSRLPVFLEDERQALNHTFPNGMVDEDFRTRLWLART